jgi:septum formation protein
MTTTSRWIYLASQSPRRRQLLDQIGVAHELLLPDADEDAEALEAVRPGEAPRTYVQRVTRAKLAAAQQRLARSGRAPAPILCADTTVALGRRILGKPADAAEAAGMLAALAGREHRVLTAVALAREDGASALRLSESRVRFAPLDAARIAAYVATGEPMGKAGAYAIQSGAAAWVAHIAGSYSGIMGLPLFETSALLRDAGWPL